MRKKTLSVALVEHFYILTGMTPRPPSQLNLRNQSSGKGKERGASIYAKRARFIFCGGSRGISGGADGCQGGTRLAIDATITGP
jgi:hypothetical protein